MSFRTLITHGDTITPMHLKTSIITLVAIDTGYVVASLYRIPVSIIICSGALLLLAVCSVTSKNEALLKDEGKSMLNILKEVNWDILFFMIGIFLVVQGLRHVGADEFFAKLFVRGLALPSILSILVPSLTVTVSASVMNNWPMTMLGLLSIRRAVVFNSLNPRDHTSLIFANVIGNNLGPHFFPFGSLAILMWLGAMKRKGLTIRLVDYLKVGSVLSILEVIAASIVLWAELNFLQLELAIPP